VLANAGSLQQPVGALLQGIAFAVFVAIVLTLRRRAGRPSAQARGTPRRCSRIYSQSPAATLFGTLAEHAAVR